MNFPNTNNTIGNNKNKESNMGKENPCYHLPQRRTLLHVYIILLPHVVLFLVLSLSNNFNQLHFKGLYQGPHRVLPGVNLDKRKAWSLMSQDLVMNGQYFGPQIKILFYIKKNGCSHLEMKMKNFLNQYFDMIYISPCISKTSCAHIMVAKCCCW